MESLSQTSSSAACVKKVRIGTAGWAYKDWEGIFYPHDLPHRRIHPLEYFARFFDTAEITASFDGPLRPEHVKLWCRRVASVNRDFLFTAKLSRAFTHSPNSVLEPTSAASIRPTDEDEVMTREGLDALATSGRLGALVIQFPLSFKNTSLNRDYLDRLLRQFIEYPRVVEVRDSTWDNPDTIASFMQRNVAFCNIDPPAPAGSPASIESVSPLAYVRLHGLNVTDWFDSDIRDDRGDYLYKESELPAWKEKIESAAATAQTTYVIASNCFESKAAANALELKAMLNGKRVPAPPTLIKKYPELRKFADASEGSDTDPGPQITLLA
ncbi:MAG TPA: DUF72 domain-containing protein [Candidatus Sulfotelmatobacter sp.]|jgi:uncharacterized protein YecE (DUF72 family)